MPTVTVVINSTSGPTTSRVLQKVGSGSTSMRLSPFTFSTNPITFCPAFFNGPAAATSGFYGLTGYYNGKPSWAGPNSDKKYVLSQINGFTVNSTGIFDVTSNPTAINLIGDTATSGSVITTGGLSLTGRNGLYWSSWNNLTDAGSNNYYEGKAIFPNLSFRNENILLSQSVFKSQNTVAQTTGAQGINLTCIDDLGIEHMTAFQPFNGNAPVLSTGVLSVISNNPNYPLLLTPISTPLVVTHNGGTCCVWGGQVHNDSVTGHVANPVTGNVLSYGISEVTSSRLWTTNLFAPEITIFNPITGVYTTTVSFPGLCGLSFSDPADQAIMDAQLLFSGVYNIPGGGFFMSTTVTGGIQIFLIDDNCTRYISIFVALPAGVTSPGFNANGNIGIDLNGNLWLLNQHNGANFSGVYTTFAPWLTIDIPAPLLSTFGLSCRVMNPCTTSFEG